MNTDTDSWGEDEAAGVDFGDRRLARRLAKLLDTLGRKPTESIPSALGGWSEITAAYRFFDNERVTASAIFSGHHAATLQRMQGLPVILGIQDTTFVNYDGQRAIRDLGRHNDELEHGYFIHPVLAVTPEGVCLGVLHAETWARGPKEAIKPTRRHRPIEVKESMRWLRGYDALDHVSPSVAQARLICVGDRESDIYDLFAHAQGHHADWLVRATQDRTTTNGQRTRDVVAEQPALGSYSLEVPPKGPYAGRVAQVEVRAARTTLHAPHRTDRDLPDVDVTVIVVSEVNAPAPLQSGPAIEWVLVTSVPCPKNLDEALEIVGWYRCRWTIERFFHVLKTGCTIEELQLQTRKRLEAAMAVYAIIAWRILFTTMLARTDIDIPASSIFTPDEIIVAYGLTKRPKPDTPLLRDVVPLVASLGGYIIRKGQGPAGPKTLWQGWQHVRMAVVGLELARELGMARNV